MSLATLESAAMFIQTASDILNDVFLIEGVIENIISWRKLDTFIFTSI